MKEKVLLPQVRDITTWISVALLFSLGAPAGALEALYVTSAGDVGIGTTSPDAPLEVKRTNGNYAPLIMLTNDGSPRIVFNDTSASADWILQPIASSAGSHFQITLAGTGGFELQVDTNGNLRARGNIYSGGTQLNVPDYVFGPDYELRPMVELRAFIAKHGHLPNVPSSEELRTHGLNHGEFQMRLLEKIEELTLYTLQQQRLIEKLQARDRHQTCHEKDSP